jgi:hypothetical protein
MEFFSLMRLIDQIETLGIKQRHNKKLEGCILSVPNFARIIYCADKSLSSLTLYFTLLETKMTDFAREYFNI